MGDIDELKRRLLAAEAGLAGKTHEVEKLKFELARLKRLTFGQSSERIEHEIEQLELKLEEIETTKADAAPIAAPDEPGPQAASGRPAERKPRRQLPEHLTRVTETHEPAPCACPRCGSGKMRKAGEDVAEVLEYLPGRFEVVRHVRPAYSCGKCEAMAQAPMPALPIPRGQAGASIIVHLIMSKCADNLPLYRQAEIYARDGLDLDHGLLADQVGKAASLCGRWPSGSASTRWRAA
jgi:transposase